MALLPVGCSFGGTCAARQSLRLPLPAQHGTSPEAPWQLTCYRSWPRPTTAPYTPWAFSLASIVNTGVNSAWMGYWSPREQLVLDMTEVFVKLQLMKRFLFSSLKQEQCSRESWLFRWAEQGNLFLHRDECVWDFFFFFWSNGKWGVSTVGSFGKMPVDKHVPSFSNSVPSKRSSPRCPLSCSGFRFGQREGKAAAFWPELVWYVTIRGNSSKFKATES